MLTSEQNLLLTRIGPGTPMGGLIRSYWIPVLFTRQLPTPDCDPVRVRLLGEDLVAFRDTQGRIGLLDERCPHRTASMFLGRNEEGGLRCVYHGWKFDVHGACLDMPTEPKTSQMKARVKAKAYPCVEHGGVVWTYMGAPEQEPAFPAIEWTQLPGSHLLVTRHLQQCNWLQAFEGGFDSSHFSFLHKGDLLYEHTLPTRTELVPTDSGFLFVYGRDDKERTTWTTDTMLMPFHKLIATPLPESQIWVPIDDETTMLYCITYSPERPMIDAERADYGSGDRIHAENEPGSDRMVRHAGNDYLIDRARQRSGRSFSGIKGIGSQDCAAQESMGPIADRTIEHLGAGDVTIVQLRRYLLRAVEDYLAGRPLPGRDPNSYRLRPLSTSAPKEVSMAEVIANHLKQATAGA